MSGSRTCREYKFEGCTRTVEGTRTVLVRGKCSRTVRVRVLQGFIFPAARKGIGNCSTTSTVL